MKKLFQLTLMSIKVLASTASSIALIFAGSHAVHAAPADQNSPLLSQSQPSQASVAKLVGDIKASAGGAINAGNIQAAISEAIAANPGVNVDMIAAAINQLSLDAATLNAAISGAADTFGVGKSDIVAGMFTDTYMTQGREAANSQIAMMRGLLGDAVVDDAMKDLPTAMLSAEELAGIQPAGGDVYNG